MIEDPLREYELTVVYDLAVQEAGGPEASVELLTNVIEARGGKLLKVDHWGRRRMAYPINRMVDGDYIVTRVEFEPNAVAPLEATLGIDERIFRHLIVRADELPLPLPPREPRQQPGFAPPPPQQPAAEMPAEPAVVAAAEADEPAAPPMAEESVAIAPAVEASAEALAADGSPEGVAEQAPADAANTEAAEAIAEPATEPEPEPEA
ncbi:MAG: 30S ribosomal protein S6 [Tepidiformaceae bacterium]